MFLEFFSILTQIYGNNGKSGDIGGNDAGKGVMVVMKNVFKGGCKDCCQGGGEDGDEVGEKVE